MTAKTLADLRKDHMRGDHGAVPVFACRFCIAERDAFWVCSCSAVHPPRRSICFDCGAVRPLPVVESSLVPTTIKSESSR